MNLQIDQLQVSLMAQSVGYCTATAEIMGLSPGFSKAIAEGMPQA